MLKAVVEADRVRPTDPEVAVRLRAPVVKVRPLEAVSSPAEVMVPVPVVAILPVVDMVILAAKSPPTTELNVGAPAALPCKSVVVVPARVPSSPAAVLVTTPAVVRPESVTDVVAESVLKAPVEAVVAPIAVELMPVAVVLKLEEVIVRALAPVLMEEADSPERVRAPDVAVRFIAPVVRVRPLEAVRVDENLPVPTTSRVVAGAVVPMPTVPSPRQDIILVVVASPPPWVSPRSSWVLAETPELT